MRKHLTGLAEWSIPEAGMFVWFKLLLPPTRDSDEGDSEDLIVRRALKEKVLALPGTSFFTNGRTSAYVRASFSVLPEEHFDEAMRRLAAVVREVQLEGSKSVGHESASNYNTAPPAQYQQYHQQPYHQPQIHTNTNQQQPPSGYQSHYGAPPPPQPHQHQQQQQQQHQVIANASQQQIFRHELPTHHHHQAMQQQPPHPHQQHPQQQAESSASGAGGATGDIIASRKDDWTSSLVRMAKSAELKKHALSLQLQTTKIMSYDTTLQKKVKALNDFKKQRERLESQRTSLLAQLREINESREKVDLEESKAQKECDDLRKQINELEHGEYAIAKVEVDKLRRELGLEETKSLKSQLEERAAKQRRSSAGNPGEAGSSGTNPEPTSSPPPPSQLPQKRGPGRPPKSATTGAPAPPATPVVTSTPSDAPSDGGPPAKRPRGRPKGSKNKPKPAVVDGATGQPPVPATGPGA
ncbi:hypothetical protein FRC00_003209 [Tulasnella sp. 408]|nr:hypothetical protein FRC00_003209 [Tulasnella sp. 408]